jgi:hypothetical protein
LESLLQNLKHKFRDKIFLNRVFPILAAFLGGAQATYMWLTHFPSADNLIETIAAQLYLQMNVRYWYYPGQAHGGLLELPLQVLLLKFSSNNILVAPTSRIIFAMLSSYFLAKIYMLITPRGNNAIFMIALFLAPSLLRDLWMFGGGYSLSWALQLGAVYLLLKLPTQRNLCLSGLLVSLSFYEQPTSLLLFLVFIPFIFSKIDFKFNHYLFFVMGFLPVFLISIFLRASISNIVYSPISETIKTHRILGSLGLKNGENGNPSLIHNAIGLANGPGRIGALSILLVWIIYLIAVFFVLRKGIAPHLRNLGFSWLLASLGLSVLTSIVVTDSWFYGLSFCLFIPLAVAAIISSLPKKSLQVMCISGLVLNFFLIPSALSTNGFSNIADSHRIVTNHSSNLSAFANNLLQLKVEYIYGTYDEVYPVMAASKSQIFGIPKTFNRFQSLVDDKLEFKETHLIAVRNDSKEINLEIDSCQMSSLGPQNLENSFWDIYICEREGIKKLNNWIEWN